MVHGYQGMCIFFINSDFGSVLLTEAVFPVCAMKAWDMMEILQLLYAARVPKVGCILIQSNCKCINWVDYKLEFWCLRSRQW